MGKGDTAMIERDPEHPHRSLNGWLVSLRQCEKCGSAVEAEWDADLGGYVAEDHECTPLLDQVAKLRSDLAFVASELFDVRKPRIQPMGAWFLSPELERLQKIAKGER